MNHSSNTSLMKVINSRLHGILDYIVVLALWTAPSLFDFTDFTDKFLYGLGAIHLILTLFTDFKAGMFKLIPLSIHGMIEFVVSLFLVLSPWIFGLMDESTDRNFIIGFGILVFVVFILTSYTPAPTAEETVQVGEER